MAMMTFPDGPEDDDEGQDVEARREFRQEWMDILEDEQIAEGDITVSETIGGKDPEPDLDDEDEFDDILDQIVDEDDLV